MVIINRDLESDILKIFKGEREKIVFLKSKKGGKGKSTICRNLYLIDDDEILFFEPINFVYSTNYSIPNIILSIINCAKKKLLIKEDDSRKIYDTIELYKNSARYEKKQHLKEMFSLFYAFIDNVVLQKRIVLIFDTIEKLANIDYFCDIIEFINNLNEKIRILFSGREKAINFVEKIKDAKYRQLELRNYRFNEFKTFLIKLNKNKKIKDNVISELYERIVQNGDPLYCSIYSSLFLQKASKCSDLISYENLLQFFYINLVENNKKNKGLLKVFNYLLLCSRGLSSEILTKINIEGWDKLECARLLMSLKKIYSFVSYDEISNFYTIHETIIEKVLSDHNYCVHNFNNEEKNMILENLQNFYQNNKTINISNDVDSIFYLFKYNFNFDTICYFDYLFVHYLEKHIFSYNNLLISEILYCSNEYCELLVDLYNADVYLKNYFSSKAKESYEQIIKRLKSFDDCKIKKFILTRAYEGIANCIINPNSVLCNNVDLDKDKLNNSIKNIFCLTEKSRNEYYEVKRIFKKETMYYEEKLLSHRVSYASMIMAKMYQTIGLHNHSEKCFITALDYCQDKNFKMDIYCELSNLYRLRQNLEKTANSLYEALSIAVELNYINNEILYDFPNKKSILLKFSESITLDPTSNKNINLLGNLVYNTSNYLRDLIERDENGDIDYKKISENYEIAKGLYQIAEGIFIKIDDPFKTSELYGDFAWFYYLLAQLEEEKEPDKFIENCKLYLDKYEKSFKSETEFSLSYSELYHMKYHLEMFNAKQKFIDNNLKELLFNNAYEYLNIAIIKAIEYQNIYMLLDCLNHKVEEYYSKLGKEMSLLSVKQKIFDVISIMISFEKNKTCNKEKFENIICDTKRPVCAFKAFVGRSMIIYSQLLEGDKKYCSLNEGFKRVAIYGDSGTNVEIFEMLFEKYKEQLIEMLQNKKICEEWKKLKNKSLLWALKKLEV